MDPIQTPADRTSAKRWGTAAALVAAGLAGGVILAGTVSANASTSTPSPSASSSAPSVGGDQSKPSVGGDQNRPTNPNPGDPSKPQRSDETLLTGDVADKVTAAVLAEYPGATIVRVETDSDGVYEAHITKADGTQVSVEVDKSYTVTGEEAGGMRGGHGGGMPGGVDPDPNDNDGPGTDNPGGTLTPNGSSTTSSSSVSG
jgi:hypothetical protein